MEVSLDFSLGEILCCFCFCKDSCWTFQLLSFARGKSDLASCASNLNICRSELERQNSEDTALRSELDCLRPTLTSLQHLGFLPVVFFGAAKVPTGLGLIEFLWLGFGGDFVLDPPGWLQTNEQSDTQARWKI